MKIFVGRVLVVIVWGLIWEITARTEALPPAFIGQPSLFLADFAEHIVDGTFPAATLITLQAVAAAFVIGALLALLTALAMTVFPIVERLFSPIVDALNALPRVALIPLFILWFGLGLVQNQIAECSIRNLVGCVSRIELHDSF